MAHIKSRTSSGTSKRMNLELLKELVHKYGIQVRVLTPLDDSIKQLVQELGKYADIRYIPEELQTKITIGKMIFYMSQLQNMRVP